MATSRLSGVGQLACLAVLAGTSFCLWQQPSSAAVQSKISGVHRVYRRRLIKRPLLDDDVGFRKLEKNLSAHVYSITENRKYFAHIDYPAGKELLVSAWDVSTKKPRNATTTEGNTTTTSKAVSASNVASKKVPGTRRSRRRRHAAVGDMEEAEVEEAMKTRDRSHADEGKKTRTRRRKKRLREEVDDHQSQALLGSESALDRFFRKEKTDDFFKNLDETAASRDNDDDIESVYARDGGQFFQRNPSGILTDVTYVDKETPYFEEEEEEDVDAALMRRAVPLSNLAAPGADGSLTLGKLASVLNSNVSITHLQLFSDNPSIAVPWEEPEIMSNCWLHKMLAGRYAFSPSCKEDGNYFNKQCHLERCWCVENDGRTRDRKFLTRFSYKKFGEILYCTPPIRQGPIKVLPKTPQTQQEAMLEDQNANSTIPSSKAQNVSSINPSAQAQNQTGNAKPSIPSAQSPTIKP